VDGQDLGIGTVWGGDSECLRTRECYIFFPAFPGMLVCCFVGDEVGNVMIW
jgi:hypothetical protein